MRLVHEWAELRSERLNEITTQLGVPFRYWAPIVDLNPTTHAHTLELLAVALRLGYHVLQPIKHYLGCPRPAAYSASIQPVIRPRRFDAFPSGHAMEAFLVARLLAALAGDKKDGPVDTPLQRQAARIANNRVVAGVHFHIDSVAGRMVAESLAEYVLSCCGAVAGRRGWVHRQFNGQALQREDPALNSALQRKEVMHGGKVASSYFLCNKNTKPSLPAALKTSAVTDRRAPGLLNHLWKQAQAEWR